MSGKSRQRRRWQGGSIHSKGGGQDRGTEMVGVAARERVSSMIARRVPGTRRTSIAASSKVCIKKKRRRRRQDFIK